MSSVCGIYFLDGRPVTAETGEAMMRELGAYHADYAGTWYQGQVFLGCHVLFLTPESMLEALPYHDSAARLTITSDAVIDNRDELCNRLRIEPARMGNMADSQLILLAYQKWGRDCPKYLLGDFAFAIWDDRCRTLFCAVDHTGTKSFYYYRSGGVFAFSTLLRPLFVISGISKKYNETWIADFLALPTVMHQLDPELTMYKDIYLLPAGHTLTVKSERADKQLYWQVERQPELKLPSDNEYEEAFREVLGEAVRCRLRNIRRVGAMMSGGLDSTSVACLAARELKSRNNQRLISFSSIPEHGYRDWLAGKWIADETPYIEAVRQHNGNIDVVYCRAEGKHPLNGTDRLLEILEQPYKIIENLFWIDDIITKGKELDVGVILSGGAGNATISWGEPIAYLLSLYRGGKWLSMCRESWGFARLQDSPLKALYVLFRTLFPYNKQSLLHPRVDQQWQKILGLSVINRDFAKRVSVHERFRQFRYLLFKPMDSWETRQTLLSPAAFSHNSVITTKLGLANQVVLRDPTMDKRVIEFCLSVPENQYVRNGRERDLIRRAMAGIVPDKVLLNETVKGAQGADWAQRIENNWTELKDEISKTGSLEIEREYLDIAKIQETLNKHNTLDDAAAENFGIRVLVRTLIFSRFLRKNQ